MNLIQWANDNLDYRCLMFDTFLNIDGGTEQVLIRLGNKTGRATEFRKVYIERDGSILEVFLSDIDSIGPSMYHFTYDVDRSGMLLIPLMPMNDDDGC